MNRFRKKFQSSMESAQRQVEQSRAARAMVVNMPPFLTGEDQELHPYSVQVGFNDVGNSWTEVGLWIHYNFDDAQTAAAFMEHLKSNYIVEFDGKVKHYSGEQFYRKGVLNFNGHDIDITIYGIGKPEGCRLVTKTETHTYTHIEAVCEGDKVSPEVAISAVS